MKNWEIKFDEMFIYGEKIGKNERKYTLGTRDNLKKFIRNLIADTRKETILAVLPEKQREYSFDNQEFPESRGCNNCRQEIIDRTKEKFNIELK